MKRRWHWAGLATLLVTASGALAAALRAPSFQGAPPGAAVPFVPVALPTTALPAEDFALLASGAGPGGPGGPGGTLSFPVFRSSPWTPPLSELLTGALVIETRQRMRDVWERLFDEPYDTGAVDFDTEFVVWMADGPLVLDSFQITSVEVVDASWEEPPGLGTVVDPFLAVTGTKVVAPIPPDPQDPAFYRVSAVRVPRSAMDDVVFHRAELFAP